MSKLSRWFDKLDGWEQAILFVGFILILSIDGCDPAVHKPHPCTTDAECIELNGPGEGGARP